VTDGTAPDPTADGWARAAVSAQLDALATRLTERGVAPTAAPAHRGWQAATALVLAPGEQDIEVAIIERTRREGDRWSGQLALPGGRREEADRSLAETAARETREEVGLVLGPALALLAQHRARVRPGVVACYAFVLDQPRSMVPDPLEVASAWWIPLGALTDRRNATTLRYGGLPFPAIDVQGRALWGLTLKLLERFAELADLELATR
jgi:8-oxo-dGTP pyrophosphatase MutT (NUDIX family)